MSPFLWGNNMFSLFFLHVLTHLQSFILFLLDESTEGEVAYPLTKEEEEVETMRSWIEAGGFPAWPEGEAKAVLMEVGPSSCIYLPIYMKLSMMADIHLFLLFCFQGIDLLKKASHLRQEACRLEEEVQHLEAEGWGKLGEAMAGSEAEGFYGFLRGAAAHSLPLPSQPPPKKPHPIPSATISQPPPQDSKGPEVSDPADQAAGPASPAAPLAPEEAIPAHMQPLRVQVGGIKWVYKCWVEGCKEGPSTSQATISAHIQKVHLGVRLVCPLCGKTFFNPDVLRCHKKVHTA